MRIGAPFSKRASDTAGLSLSDLKAHLDKTRKTIRELVTEREGLALPALRGNAAAIQRIEAIDAERAKLVATDETLNAAIRSVQSEQRVSSWRVHLPNMQRAFRVELGEAWTHWPGRLERLLLGRQSHDIIDLRDALADLDKLEAATAHQIADRILPDARMPFYRASDQEELSQHAKRTPSSCSCAAIISRRLSQNS
jgi:hypothetical protein